MTAVMTQTPESQSWRGVAHDELTGAEAVAASSLVAVAKDSGGSHVHFVVYDDEGQVSGFIAVAAHRRRMVTIWTATAYRSEEVEIVTATLVVPTRFSRLLRWFGYDPDGEVS